MKSFVTTIIFLVLFAANNLMAQSNFKLLEKSTMKIEGTSNVHDWTAEVQSINSEFIFDAMALESETKTTPVQTLVLDIPVDKIESGKGGMNRKMQGALKKDEHPSISFELLSSELSPTGTNGNKASFQLMANGVLTIAGTSQEVSLPVDCYIQEDDSYKFTGSYTINMKDYKVDPPTAVFGTIRSGENVYITYELFFEKI